MFRCDAPFQDTHAQSFTVCLSFNFADQRVSQNDRGVILTSLSMKLKQEGMRAGDKKGGLTKEPEATKFQFLLNSLKQKYKL